MSSGGLSGRVIHGHQILRLLGAGGVGEVYLARDPVLAVERVIKIVHEEAKDLEAAHKRFDREAKVLTQLQHTNIVQVIDFGRLENGSPYLVMELIDGPTLGDEIELKGPRSLAESLMILAQLAGALEHGHRHEVVHRDLKPGNVLLRDGDPRQVKLNDYGLTRVLSPETLARVTTDQQALGSPLFMSPEQAGGGVEVGPPADIYALAGVGYTLLSGKPVFEDRPLLAMATAHMNESPPRLSARVPSLPRRLDDLLYACLDKVPAVRPSAEELAAHFGALLGQVGTPPANEARPGVSGVKLAHLLSRSIPEPIKESLRMQALAIIRDLAGVLEVVDPDLGRLARELDALDEQATRADTEVALYDSQLNDAQGDDRLELEWRRVEAWRGVEGLKAKLASRRLDMIVRVEAARRQPGVPDRAFRLYGELDAVAARLAR